MAPRFIIYGLTDPRTGEVRYIGQSSRGIRRAHEHTNKHSLVSSSRKNRWIKGLIADGVKYGITILQELNSVDELDDAECRWIDVARSRGWDITNGNAGGLGGQPSEETRAKLSALWKGRRHTPEAIARMRAAHLGKKMPESMREKMRAVRTGTKASEETKARMRNSMLGRTFTDEAIEKMRLAAMGNKKCLGRKHRPETIEKMRAVALRRYGHE